MNWQVISDFKMAFHNCVVYYKLPDNPHVSGVTVNNEVSSSIYNEIICHSIFSTYIAYQLTHNEQLCHTVWYVSQIHSHFKTKQL